MGDDSHSLDAIVARAAAEPDGFCCERAGTEHRLEIWGRLPADWAGHLGLQLFAAGVQVVAGDALRTQHGTWAAHFRLRASDVDASLQHDFLTMARRAPRLVPPLPDPVVTISATPCHESPGSVHAHVEGKDSIGLVTHVLAHFGRLGLQPRRFSIRTRGDRVEDWFWLEPNEAPSPGSATRAPLQHDWQTHD